MSLQAAVLDLIRRFDDNTPQCRSLAYNETEALRAGLIAA